MRLFGDKDETGIEIIRTLNKLLEGIAELMTPKLKKYNDKIKDSVKKFWFFCMINPGSHKSIIRSKINS
jgi:hypothetical protein